MFSPRFVLSLTLIVFCDGKLASWDTDVFRINSFVINSTESLRFATVDITTVIENLVADDKELKFEIQIPKSAFISGFKMRVGDKEMKAYIADKTRASDIYNDAKENNITAGHVTQQSTVADDKDRDIFRISVNIAEKTTAQLKLQYQELLERHAGTYKQRFYIFPRNIVTNILVKCEFTEKQDFTKFDFKVPLEDTKFAKTSDLLLENNFFTKRLEWKPDNTIQSSDVEEDYVFEVEYELKPLDNGGQVFYNEEGKFAHYFSSNCNSTNIYSKLIIFLIDVSGSMKGIAIEQVLLAMGLILDQLRITDMFNIILFSDYSKIYSSEFVQANPSSVQAAKSYLQTNVKAVGATNVNDGLMTAMRLFREADERTNYAKTLVFLTDGEPTKGITSRSIIRENLKATNYHGQVECCKAKLFIIAFSKTADINFLRALAYDQSGTLRVIRESLEFKISIELLDLYTEIHNPYYKGLNFTYYVGDNRLPEVNITQSYFPNYDCGSEIVIGGDTIPGALITPRVTAKGLNSLMNFNSIQTERSTAIHTDTLSRLVAYKKVQEYVKVMQSSTDKTAAALAKTRAINISLQMEFVTPVTSLVVAFYRKKPIQLVNDNRAFTRGGISSRVAGAPPTFNLYDQEYEEDEETHYNSAPDFCNAPKLVIRFLILVLTLVI